MSDALDDRMKQAQIDKTSAETEKLRRETEGLKSQAWGNFWSEAIKVLGGVLLGVGGVVVAYTQYEVSELKAKIAKDDLERARIAKADAEKVQVAAEAAASAAYAKRDLAIKEQRDSEATVAELKNYLAQTKSALNATKPAEARARLAYIHFRGDLTRDLINELRATLASKSFDAPGSERVAGDYQNLVKYFRDNDSTPAANLAAVVETFFTAKGCPLKLRVVPSGAANLPDPPLEVWLAHKCTK